MTTPSLRARTALVIVAVTCALLQIASATFFGRDLQTPNTSTAIAQRLVAQGEYGVNVWHRFRGPHADLPAEPVRAFQLPGEPLYLAAGFAMLPAPLQRYLHVPVTVAFVLAIAAVALLIGGPRLALLAGLVASVEPFIVFHGPIWDDTFLASALEWGVVAALLVTVAASENGVPSRRRWLLIGAVAIAAGWAGVTRMQSQATLGGLALIVLAFRRFRPARQLSLAILLGLIVGLGLWGARNARTFGAFEIGTSHDGLGLFESNYADARDSIYRTGTAEGLSQSDHLARQFAENATLDEFAADRQLKRDAWTYISGHPIDVAKTAVLKLALSLTGFDFGSPRLSARNVVTVFTNLVLLAVGGVGLLKFWGSIRSGVSGQLAGTAFLIWLASTLLMLAAGPVGIRYRISLTGFLYIGAASVLVRGRRTADDRVPALTIGELHV